MSAAFSEISADDPAGTVRHFVTYSGIRPPARLVEPLEPAALEHRNTFVRAVYDADDRLIRFDKMVYGAVELTHEYTYHPTGRISWARVTVGGETATMTFDADGRPTL